jgi:peptidyl-prolyl cis-trans isomerase D
MLDTLRESSKSIVTYVIVGGLCFAMAAIFGPGSCTSLSSSGTPFAATVNGSVVTVAAFEQEYSNEFHQYQQRAGGSFSPELADQMRLRDRVMDNLIDQELLAQDAERRGIYISDQELADKIQHDFSKDGTFDPAWYKQVVLQYYQMSPVAFEMQIRKKMVVAKEVAAITAAAEVSDDEVRAEYRRDNEKVDLQFVRFAPANFSHDALPPSDDEAKAWAEKNQDKIKDFYGKNSFRYNKPPKVTAHQILVKVDDDAPADKVAAAKKKIDEAKADLDSGKDFGETAKKFSDDATSKDRGGDLGEVNTGVKGKEFDEAVAALAEGKISAPFRDALGFHIVRLDKKIPAVNRTIDEVRLEIAKELITNERSEELAKKSADETLRKLEGGAKLAELWPSEKKEKDSSSEFQFSLGSKKPEVDDTGEFGAQGDFVPHIGVSPEIENAAFGADEKKQPWLDKAYHVNNAYYVLAIKSRTHADLSQLEAKMPELREKTRKQKAEALVEAYLKNIKDQSRIDRNAALLGPKTKGPGAEDEG